jgi:streptomycin 3"-adenylyltransferase
MHENRFYSYETCTKDIKKQISDVVNVLSHSLSNNLLGLYLQGSMVLGTFDEDNSDIDMIGVVDNPLASKEKIELGSKLLSIDKKPCLIEVDIFTKGNLIPWQYPPVCNFYFSDYFSEQYKQFLLGENLSHRLLTSNANTTNSTPCLKLTKEKGICLYGMRADKLITDIPNSDIWDAISSGSHDLDAASDNDSHRPFAILTLCRILSYRETGEIFSKQEAAFWAMGVLPEIFSPIISNALFDKYGLGEKKAYTVEDAISFKSYILERIK